MIKNYKKIIVDNLCKDISTFKIVIHMYYDLFDQLPKVSKIVRDNSGKAMINDVVLSQDFSYYFSEDDDDNNKNISINLKEYCFCHINGIYIFSDQAIIYYQGSQLIALYNNINTINRIIEQCIPNLQIINEPTYLYTVYSNNGFFNYSFKIKENFNLDISKYYNDDLPYSELKEFCKSNSCGLSLLYGSPGCGKTTLIKNLIYELKGINFIIMESNMLSNSGSSEFIEYLTESKESVVIFEDCEKLLTSREISNNPYINTMLNLTDGLIGEALGIKFICTFNTSLKNIDSALLREGRLKLSYEFKPLVKEKSKILCDEQNVPCKGNMTLAEIFKKKIEINNPNKTNKMGF